MKNVPKKSRRIKIGDKVRVTNPAHEHYGKVCTVHDAHTIRIDGRRVYGLEIPGNQYVYWTSEAHIQREG